MKITISELIEHEDGSATYKVDTDREGTELLVQEGLRHILCLLYTSPSPRDS